MTEFNSESLEVQAPAIQVYDFLSDFTHFQHLMPDQITNWKADHDNCSFTIDGLASLSMRMASKSPHSNIHIISDGKNPLDYTLDIFMKEAGNEKCNVEVVFSADLNPFIKAMASRPLQNFVDLLATKLQQNFSRS